MRLLITVVCCLILIHGSSSVPGFRRKLDKRFIFSQALGQGISLNNQVVQDGDRQNADNKLNGQSLTTDQDIHNAIYDSNINSLQKSKLNINGNSKINTIDLTSEKKYSGLNYGSLHNDPEIIEVGKSRSKREVVKANKTVETYRYESQPSRSRFSYIQKIQKLFEPKQEATHKILTKHKKIVVENHTAHEEHHSEEIHEHHTTTTSQLKVTKKKRKSKRKPGSQGTSSPEDEDEESSEEEVAGNDGLAVKNNFSNVKDVKGKTKNNKLKRTRVLQPNVSIIAIRNGTQTALQKNRRQSEKVLENKVNTLGQVSQSKDSHSNEITLVKTGKSAGKSRSSNTNLVSKGIDTTIHSAASVALHTDKNAIKANGKNENLSNVSTVAVQNNQQTKLSQNASSGRRNLKSLIKNVFGVRGSNSSIRANLEAEKTSAIVKDSLEGRNILSITSNLINNNNNNYTKQDNRENIFNGSNLSKTSVTFTKHQDKAPLGGRLTRFRIQKNKSILPSTGSFFNKVLIKSGENNTDIDRNIEINNGEAIFKVPELSVSLNSVPNIPNGPANVLTATESITKTVNRPDFRPEKPSVLREPKLIENITKVPVEVENRPARLISNELNLPNSQPLLTVPIQTNLPASVPSSQSSKTRVSKFRRPKSKTITTSKKILYDTDAIDIEERNAKINQNVAINNSSTINTIPQIGENKNSVSKIPNLSIPKLTTPIQNPPDVPSSQSSKTRVTKFRRPKSKTITTSKEILYDTNAIALEESKAKINQTVAISNSGTINKIPQIVENKNSVSKIPNLSIPKSTTLNQIPPDVPSSQSSKTRVTKFRRPKSKTITTSKEILYDTNTINLEDNAKINQNVAISNTGTINNVPQIVENKNSVSKTPNLSIPKLTPLNQIPPDVPSSQSSKTRVTKFRRPKSKTITTSKEILYDTDTTDLEESNTKINQNVAINNSGTINKVPQIVENKNSVSKIPNLSIPQSTTLNQIPPDVPSSQSSKTRVTKFRRPSSKTITIQKKINDTNFIDTELDEIYHNVEIKNSGTIFNLPNEVEKNSSQTAIPFASSNVPGATKSTTVTLNSPSVLSSQPSVTKAPKFKKPESKTIISWKKVFPQASKNIPAFPESKTTVQNSTNIPFLQKIQNIIPKFRTPKIKTITKSKEMLDDTDIIELNEESSEINHNIVMDNNKMINKVPKVTGNFPSVPIVPTVPTNVSSVPKSTTAAIANSQSISPSKNSVTSIHKLRRPKSKIITNSNEVIYDTDYIDTEAEYTEINNKIAINKNKVPKVQGNLPSVPENTPTISESKVTENRSGVTPLQTKVIRKPNVVEGTSIVVKENGKGLAVPTSPQLIADKPDLAPSKPSLTIVPEFRRPKSKASPTLPKIGNENDDLITKLKGPEKEVITGTTVLQSKPIGNILTAQRSPLITASTNSSPSETLVSGVTNFMRPNDKAILTLKKMYDAEVTDLEKRNSQINNKNKINSNETALNVTKILKNLTSVPAIANVSEGIPNLSKKPNRVGVLPAIPIMSNVVENLPTVQNSSVSTGNRLEIFTKPSVPDVPRVIPLSTGKSNDSGLNLKDDYAERNVNNGIVNNEKFNTIIENLSTVKKVPKLSKNIPEYLRSLTSFVKRPLPMLPVFTPISKSSDIFNNIKELSSVRNSPESNESNKYQNKPEGFIPSDQNLPKPADNILAVPKPSTILSNQIKSEPSSTEISRLQGPNTKNKPVDGPSQTSPIRIPKLNTPKSKAVPTSKVGLNDTVELSSDSNPKSLNNTASVQIKPEAVGNLTAGLKSPSTSQNEPLVPSETPMINNISIPQKPKTIAVTTDMEKNNKNINDNPDQYIYQQKPKGNKPSDTKDSLKHKTFNVPSEPQMTKIPKPKKSTTKVVQTSTNLEKHGPEANENTNTVSKVRNEIINQAPNVPKVSKADDNLSSQTKSPKAFWNWPFSASSLTSPFRIPKLRNPKSNPIPSPYDITYNIEEPESESNSPSEQRVPKLRPSSQFVPSYPESVSVNHIEDENSPGDHATTVQFYNLPKNGGIFPSVSMVSKASDSLPLQTKSPKAFWNWPFSATSLTSPFRIPKLRNPKSKPIPSPYDITYNIEESESESNSPSEQRVSKLRPSSQFVPSYPESVSVNHIEDENSPEDLDTTVQFYKLPKNGGNFPTYSKASNNLPSQTKPPKASWNWPFSAPSLTSPIKIPKLRNPKTKPIPPSHDITSNIEEPDSKGNSSPVPTVSKASDNLPSQTKSPKAFRNWPFSAPSLTSPIRIPKLWNPKSKPIPSSYDITYNIEEPESESNSPSVPTFSKASNNLPSQTKPPKTSWNWPFSAPSLTSPIRIPKLWNPKSKPIPSSHDITSNSEEHKMENNLPSVTTISKASNNLPAQTKPPKASWNWPFSALSSTSPIRIPKLRNPKSKPIPSSYDITYNIEEPESESNSPSVPTFSKGSNNLPSQTKPPKASWNWPFSAPFLTPPIRIPKLRNPKSKPIPSSHDITSNIKEPELENNLPSVTTISKASNNLPAQTKPPKASWNWPFSAPSLTPSIRIPKLRNPKSKPIPSSHDITSNIKEPELENKLPSVTTISKASNNLPSQNKPPKASWNWPFSAPSLTPPIRIPKLWNPKSKPIPSSHDITSNSEEHEMESNPPSEPRVPKLRPSNKFVPSYMESLPDNHIDNENSPEDHDTIVQFYNLPKNGGNFPSVSTVSKASNNLQAQSKSPKTFLKWPFSAPSLTTSIRIPKLWNPKSKSISSSHDITNNNEEHESESNPPSEPRVPKLRPSSKLVPSYPESVPDNHIEDVNSPEDHDTAAQFYNLPKNGGNFPSVPMVSKLSNNLPAQTKSPMAFWNGPFSAPFQTVKISSALRSTSTQGVQPALAPSQLSMTSISKLRTPKHHSSFPIVFNTVGLGVDTGKSIFNVPKLVENPPFISKILKVAGNAPHISKTPTSFKHWPEPSVEEFPKFRRQTIMAVKPSTGYYYTSNPSHIPHKLNIPTVVRNFIPPPEVSLLAESRRNVPMIIENHPHFVVSSPAYTQMKFPTVKKSKYRTVPSISKIHYGSDVINSDNHKTFLRNISPAQKTSLVRKPLVLPIPPTPMENLSKSRRGLSKKSVFSSSKKNARFLDMEIFNAALTDTVQLQIDEHEALHMVVLKKKAGRTIWGIPISTAAGRIEYLTVGNQEGDINFITSMDRIGRVEYLYPIRDDTGRSHNFHLKTTGGHLSLVESDYHGGQHSTGFIGYDETGEYIIPIHFEENHRLVIDPYAHSLRYAIDIHPASEIVSEVYYYKI